MDNIDIKPTNQSSIQKKAKFFGHSRVKYENVKFVEEGMHGSTAKNS